MRGEYLLRNGTSRQEMPQAIRRIGKQHPGAFIVVTGCYAQLKPEEVSHIEGVDLVLGAEQKLEILQYLENLEKKENGGAVIASQSKDIRSFSPSCSADDRTRHFLKVQDGCDYYCSYCTIPFAREEAERDDRQHGGTGAGSRT